MKVNITKQLLKLGLGLLVAIVAVSCDPLEIDTPPALAGDFSDPIYPRIYGKVSLAVDIDADSKASTAAATIKTFVVEYYFKTPDGGLVLAKKYDRLSDIPQIVSFPVGDYIVVAHSADDAGEYFYGRTTMSVTEGSKATPAIVCTLLADNFDDPIYPTTYGKVSLNVTAEADLSTPISKANLTPDVGDLVVEFYFVSTDGTRTLSKRYDTYSMMPAIVSFPIGKYEVVAKSEDEMLDVSPSAYFKGMTTMTVSATDRSSATLKALMQNSRLNVITQSAFDNAFSMWGAKLHFAGETEAQVEFSKTSPATIYIKPTDFALHLSAVQVGDNLTHSKVIPVTDVKPETDITVTLEGQSMGSLNVGISIKGNINRQDHDINFPDDDEELSGGGTNPNPNPDPDPDPVVPPTITGEGFDVDQVKEISTSADFDADGNLKTPLKVTATAKDGGIQQFVITIDSPDIGSDLLDPIFGGSSFDLANVPPGSALESNLNDLGILPFGVKVKDQESFTFDLTSFMTLLPENTITHNFTLKIKDGNEAVIEKTVRIKRIP